MYTVNVKNHRYPKETLERFRMLINRRINKAQNVLSNLLAILGYKGEDISKLQMKLYEDINEVSEQESVRNLAEHQRMLIVQLKEALNRINDGTYGVCEKTGELISEDRLLLVPNTRYSMAYKITGKSIEKVAY